MGQESPLVRQWLLIKLLSSRPGVIVNELAEEMAVSSKTIRRDLVMLKTVEVMEVRFQRPADFDLSRHFSGSFGVFRGVGDVRVRVHFSRDVARYVREAHWHASQQLDPQRDGGLLAEFQLSTTVEIKSWILSFGRHAEVLEPEALRQEIAHELAASLECYEELLEPPLEQPPVAGQGITGKRKAR